MKHSCGMETDEGGYVLDLRREQADACDGQWMQSRYYCDEGVRVRDFLIRLFGVPRAIGNDLSKVRRRIAAVSPEMQAYLGVSPETLLEEAFAKEPDLLLLDEPCYNLNAKDARRAVARIGQWLENHPSATAVCVAHSAAHVPAGFAKVLELG